MKAITGAEFNTKSGIAIIIDQKDIPLKVGERVLANGKEVTIVSMTPPPEPDKKWSAIIR